MSLDPNITALIDGQRDWFEAHVLAACCRDKAFYLRFKDVICVSTERPEDTENDFSYPADNLIYRVVKTYRTSMAGHSGLSDVPVNFVHVSLLALASTGDVLPENVEPAVLRFQSIAALPYENLLPFLTQGVGYWVSKNRTRNLAAQAMADPNFSPEEMVSRMGRASQLGRRAQGEKYEHYVGDGWEKGELNIDRIQSGITRLDKAMGGGFGMKEMTLMIGSTGAGKTVFACQLGTQFSLNGEPGILITTEQPHDQLEPRYVACHCTIPIDQIKDGIVMNKLSPDKVQRILEMQRKIGRKMKILDWINDRTKTVNEDLVEEVRKFREEHKINPRWMIFDWIGGGMGTLSTKDMAVYRLLVQATANKLADIAYDENLAVIALAQGNITLCKNNMRIDSSCLAECKTMGAKATTILGISQLQEQVDAMSNGEPPYLRKQFIYVSKARKGVGGLIPVRRAFEYQRYENWDGGEKA